MSRALTVFLPSARARSIASVQIFSTRWLSASNVSAEVLNPAFSRTNFLIFDDTTRMSDMSSLLLVRCRPRSGGSPIREGHRYGCPSRILVSSDEERDVAVRRILQERCRPDRLLQSVDQILTSDPHHVHRHLTGPEFHSALLGQVHQLRNRGDVLLLDRLFRSEER